MNNVEIASETKILGLARREDHDAWPEADRKIDGSSLKTLGIESRPGSLHNLASQSKARMECPGCRGCEAVEIVTGKAWSSMGVFQVFHVRCSASVRALHTFRLSMNGRYLDNQTSHFEPQEIDHLKAEIERQVRVCILNRKLCRVEA